MSIKIYDKRGKKNYKEQRLIDELEIVLNKKMDDNPSLKENWQPATSFEELQRMHHEYCSTDATIVEETSSKVETVDESEDVGFMDDDSFMNDDSVVGVDPMNAESPVVRDYVVGNDSLSEFNSKSTGRTSFDEPLDFNEAFEMPDPTSDSDEDDSEDTSSSRKQEPRSNDSRNQKQQPINPDYDSMSSGKKKRSTKKFAKYIVETVCVLAEKGLVWFATSNINAAKIAEYEITGEIDTSLILSLDEDQEITVKSFFAQQCYQAETLLKIDEEEKADLIDALAEVLAEKGVAPTPTQELMLISLKIFGTQAMTMIAIKAQTNAVLNQLRAQNEQQQQQNYNRQEPIQQQAVQQQEVQQEVVYEENDAQDPLTPELEEHEEELDIDKVEETKE